jgi:hypothetical protein
VIEMKKHEPEQVCGCGGPGKPVYELRHLIAMLERQEQEKREREERKKKAV